MPESFRIGRFLQKQTATSKSPPEETYRGGHGRRVQFSNKMDTNINQKTKEAPERTRPNIIISDIENEYENITKQEGHLTETARIRRLNGIKKMNVYAS